MYCHKTGRAGAAVGHGGAAVPAACGVIAATVHFLAVAAVIHAAVTHVVVRRVTVIHFGVIRAGMHLTIGYGLMRVALIRAHVAERRLQRLCCEQNKNR